MKCNFECPFYYRYEYHSAYTASIFYDRCRFHTMPFPDPKPELCDVPMQRQKKMKELMELA